MCQTTDFVEAAVWWLRMEFINNCYQARYQVWPKFLVRSELGRALYPNAIQGLVHVAEWQVQDCK